MGPDLVLLHGFTHTGASWDPVIAALGERYRAVAPDIRGHGSAADARPVTLDAVIQDVASVAPERFTLVGYSMGGRIALHAAFARALVERIEALVLIGASPGIEDKSQREARRTADERLADDMEGMTIEEFASRWSQTGVLSLQSAEVAVAAHADRLRNSTHGLAAALRGLGTGALPSLWRRLSDLRTPVTLVVGERDEKFAGIAARMADAMPTAGIVVERQVGHAVHLEAPHRIAATLAERLAR